MNFNTIVKNILEDFGAPVDTNKRSKVLKGKFTNQNSQLSDPHSTKAISGFKGQPGGKQHTLKFALPKRKKKTKKPS